MIGARGEPPVDTADGWADRALDRRLAEARAALYRLGADDAAREVYERLRACAEPPEAPAAEPLAGLAALSSAPARPFRLAAAVIALLLLGVLVVAGWVALAHGARRPSASASASASVSASSPLASALERDPGLLPAAWRGAAIESSRDDLDGARPLHGTGQVLLVVRCPASDRSFQAVAGGRTLYGACGRLQALPVADGASVLVTTRGVLPFSAALLTRSSR